MKLRVDVRRFLAACEPGWTPGLAAARDHVVPGDVDLRQLPWTAGYFAAVELDDVPDPEAWAISDVALNECRRVLGRHGMLEIRTRRRDARDAQGTERRTMALLTRLLQNHGFEVVSMDPIEQDGGSMISAIALRADAPDEVGGDAAAAPASHVTLHAPLLDGGEDSASNRALAVALDAQGVKVRVRVIFDVLDALYCE